MSDNKFGLGQLRHLYQQMINGHIKQEFMAEAAKGLLAPGIRDFERTIKELEDIRFESETARRTEPERCLDRIVKELKEKEELEDRLAKMEEILSDLFDTNSFLLEEYSKNFHENDSEYNIFKNSMEEALDKAKEILKK